MKTKQIFVSWVASVSLFLTSTNFLPQAALGQAEAPKGKPVTIRGKIAAVDSQNLKITTAAGDVLVRVPENTRVGGVTAAQLSDISAGSYVGTTATKQS